MTKKNLLQGVRIEPSEITQARVRQWLLAGREKDPARARFAREADVLWWAMMGEKVRREMGDE